MIRTVMGLLVLFLVVSAGAAPGLCEDKPKSQEITGEDFVIHGALKNPQALYSDARTPARFDRVLRLRESYVPVLIETSRAPCFKPLGTH